MSWGHSAYRQHLGSEVLVITLPVLSLPRKLKEGASTQPSPHNFAITKCKQINNNETNTNPKQTKKNNFRGRDGNEFTRFVPVPSIWYNHTAVFPYRKRLWHFGQRSIPFYEQRESSYLAKNHVETVSSISVFVTIPKESSVKCT